MFHLDDLKTVDRSSRIVGGIKQET